MEKQRDNSIKRMADFDLLRLLATVAVVFIHENWRLFGSVYEHSVWRYSWVFMAIINIITRYSVPVFFMLSGAFILSDKRNYDAVYFYKKTLKKIVLPSAATIILLLFVQIAINIHGGESLFHECKSVFKGGFYNLWFIYTLTILYLLTPLVLRIKKAISRNAYIIGSVLLMLWALFSQATSQQELAWSIGVVIAFLSYYIAGDVIKEYSILKRIDKLIIICICLSCIALSFTVRFLGYNYYIKRAYNSFFSPTIIVYSLCVFYFFSKISIDKDLSYYANLSFYIYLVHSLVLKIVAAPIEQFLSNVILCEFVVCFVTIIISFAFAVILKKICSFVQSSKMLQSFIDDSKMLEKIEHMFD